MKFNQNTPIIRSGNNQSMCAFAATKVARTGPERRQRAIVLSLDEMVDPMTITLISHIECPKMIRYMNLFWSLLVGGLEHVLFVHMSGIIFPIDFMICCSGVETTNQIMISLFAVSNHAMASLMGRFFMEQTQFIVGESCPFQRITTQKMIEPYSSRCPLWSLCGMSSQIVEWCWIHL